jgi:hypothetical protein
MFARTKVASWERLFAASSTLSSCGRRKRPQSLASAADDRLPMGEQQQVEVERRREAGVGGAQSRLRLLGLVHQRIRHEREPRLPAPAHDPVGARERAVGRNVERRLVGADIGSITTRSAWR